MQKKDKVKLLIVTQSIDINNPVLGFFHRWVEEFAKHADRISVICLEQGEYHLPDNVRVFSLGKEQLRKRTDLGNSKRSVLEEQLCKVKYVFNFYRLIWSLRNEYDVVFVHMNQEYVLMGALLWKLLRKKVIMWRNHRFGNMVTRIAIAFCDHIFCTSNYSFTATSPKTTIMPVGIDSEHFKRDPSIDKKQNSILFLGRISPVKNADVFVDALDMLDAAKVPFVAAIYGDSSEKDKTYYQNIRTKAADLEKKGKLTFHNGIPNRETPRVYNQFEVFVNTTTSGSLDKTILEAMACECFVVTSNQSFKDILPEPLVSREGDAADLAQKLQTVISLPVGDKEKYKNILRAHAEQHDISILINKVSAIMD